MKDCTTCKYGYEDEQLGIPMCHHPKRFSEDCIDFNMHEEKEIKESEKPVPKDLEEAANHYASVTDQEAHGIDFIREVFIAGGEWDREQIIKRATAAIKERWYDKFDTTLLGGLIQLGMDKQKERDDVQRHKEWMTYKSHLINDLTKAESEGYRKGKEDGIILGKEQMMKEAVDGEVYGDIMEQEEKPYQIWVESDLLPLKGNFKIGDKVRIIIVKEDWSWNCE